jgi:hypothetical protein
MRRLGNLRGTLRALPLKSLKEFRLLLSPAERAVLEEIRVPVLAFLTSEECTVAD